MTAPLRLPSPPAYYELRDQAELRRMLEQFAGEMSAKLTLNRDLVFDVRAYGARGDGVADDTGAVQAAIDAAAVVRGVVYLPPGTFKCSPLTWDRQTSIIGAGIGATTILAAGAGTLLACEHPGIVHINGTLEGFTLQGNFVGTVGLSIKNVARFAITRVVIEKFTQANVVAEGALVFQFNGVHLLDSPLGIDAFESTDTPPNLAMLRDCVIQSCATYGVRWRHGAALYIDGCDISFNGTVGDAATGGMDVGELCKVGDGVALVLANTWLEGNNGYAAVRVRPPTANPALHVVRGTHILAGTRTYGLAIDGTGPALTRFHCDVVVAQNAGTADFYSGATCEGDFVASLSSSASLGGQVHQQPTVTDSDRVALNHLHYTIGRAGADITLGSAAIFDDHAGTDGTRLQLHTTAHGSPQRVTTGAADSAGAGFRALRVPN